jgi:hypothetical protein
LPSARSFHSRRTVPVPPYDREVEATHKNKSIKVTVKQTVVECIADTIRLLDRKAKDDEQSPDEPEASE